MKVLEVIRSSSQDVVTVQLEGDEHTLPNAKLIDLADSRGDVERAKTVYNWGGTVTFLPDGKARIVVYID